MASEVTKPQVVEFVRDRDKTGHGDPEDKVRNIEQFPDGTRWALEANVAEDRPSRRFSLLRVDIVATTWYTKKSENAVMFRWFSIVGRECLWVRTGW